MISEDKSAEQAIPLTDAAAFALADAEMLASACYALANPIRVHLLSLLLTRREMTVQEMERQCVYKKLVQSVVSFHLKFLLQAELVVFVEKRGLFRYYRANREQVARVQVLLDTLQELEVRS